MHYSKSWTAEGRGEMNTQTKSQTREHTDWHRDSPTLCEDLPRSYCKSPLWDSCPYRPLGSMKMVNFTTFDMVLLHNQNHFSFLQLYSRIQHFPPLLQHEEQGSTTALSRKFNELSRNLTLKQGLPVSPKCLLLL